MKPLLLAFAIAMPLLAACASTPPQRACFHAAEAIEKDIGFCQAVVAGNTLYISGMVGQGEMPAATRSVYARLRQVLEARGVSFADVVKETVYATDLDAFIRAKEIRKEFYAGALPAATWVQVQRLYLPAFVLEVELVATLR